MDKIEGELEVKLAETQKAIRKRVGAICPGRKGICDYQIMLGSLPFKSFDYGAVEGIVKKSKDATLKRLYERALKYQEEKTRMTIGWIAAQTAQFVRDSLEQDRILREESRETRYVG